MKQEYQELLQPYFAGVPFPEIEGEKPLISIITPYFNNLQYVKEFFDSVFAQTYTNWELLFVDDASPDNQVEAIINAYAEPRIKFRRLGKNSGAAVARTALLPCLPVNMWSVSTRMTSCIPGFYRRYCIKPFPRKLPILS